MLICKCSICIIHQYHTKERKENVQNRASITCQMERPIVSCCIAAAYGRCKKLNKIAHEVD